MHPAPTLSISRILFDAVLDHLRAVYPEEGCGIIAGRDSEGAIVAVAVYPVVNQLHSRTEYAMDPRQQVETMLTIAAAGLEMVAVFHSHPYGPAGPSATDIARAYYPEALQLIVSFARPEAPLARLFVMETGRVEAATLIIE